MSRSDETPATMTPDPALEGLRTLAVYLPQFHPVPENDAWWGAGFTEWTNVARATPLYPGHYQPHVPADLGFYDLRLPETRQAQATMAAQYGISGFCYYHYWFEGRRLLERPFAEVLRSGSPDFPFCLCWANETWSRRWLGEERDILMEQTYSEADHAAHAEWLAEAFADPRYIRVAGRPLFLVYRPMHIPEPRRAIDIMRERVVRAGVPEPFFAGVDGHSAGTDFREHGYDGTVNFAPQLGVLRGAYRGDGPNLRRLGYNLLHNRRLNADLKLFKYEDLQGPARRSRPDFPHFPMVAVSWDNSPRRGRNGIIVESPTPEQFGAAVREAAKVAAKAAPGEQILFVNAWNEWAEGNHLEPDLRHGHAYLQALQAALSAR